MPATPAPALPDTSVCGRCGAGLRCGMVAGDAHCWCYRLPHLIAVPALRSGPETGPESASESGTPTGTAVPATPEASAPVIAASCLCPACLQQLIHDRQHLSSAAPARD